MKKYLDIEIAIELTEIGKKMNIDFKKWFEKYVVLKAVSIPTTIYELLTVLPKFYTYQGKEEPMSGLFVQYFQCAKQWVVGYEHCVEFDQEHLVDALGKLLIWCIQEGWVK